MKNPKVENELIHYIKSNNGHTGLYWYPLVPVSKALSVAAYDIVRIYQDGQITILENIVKMCGIEDVLLFQMDFREYFENENVIRLLYEQDEDGYVFPWYAETFLFDRSKVWLIYLSHENTITFTGEKIAAAAKQMLSSRYLIR